MPLRKSSFCNNIFITIVLLSFCRISSAENAQADTSNNPFTQRPKIGLVLSGGGARGFAHIGVLKILEKNNVPIDYIVGTSAGSIIGGLYATGLSPDEIEQSIASIEWKSVFDDFAIREYKIFRRKKDDFDFFNIHRIGLTSDGLQLSPGLIEGQQIELALDRLAYPGFGIDDYDKLRIPFRAVATNLENGESYVMKSGNLARAMRASMSIPGVLPPIEIDGNLLVDGGVADNIPIDIVRDMGADIIIVVDVSAPLSDKEDIKSSVDVTSQLTTIMTRRIADRRLKSLIGQDILITPGATDLSSSDFDKYAELISAGISASTEKLDSIKKLSLSDEEYAVYTQSLPVVANKYPLIHFIEIKNDTALRDEIIQLRIHQKIGQPLDIDQLEQDLSYIYGLDHSSSVVYSIEARENKTGLIVYVRDRTWAHNYIQFGLSIKSESNVGSFTNFDASYTNNNLNSLSGELRATVGLGSEPSISAEVYQPLNTKLDLFVSAKAGIDTTIFPVVNDGDVDSILRFQRDYLQLSAGKLYKQTTELRLGIRHNGGRTTTISGNKPATANDFTEGYYFARLYHDSLDNLSFPNTGSFSGIGYLSSRDHLDADKEYEQIQLVLSDASTYKRYTIFSRAIFETTVDENAPFNALFRRGGFLELSGTLERELAGQHFGLVEAAFYRRLGDITFLPIYAGFSIEAGNVWNRRDDISSNNTTIAGSIFIGADTFIGPLYFAFGFNDSGGQALYFNLGQTFLAD